MLVIHLLRRASRRGHRLATQLVALIVLVALLSGGAVGVLVIDRARQALREQILNSSLAAADLAGSLAAAYMSGAEGDARDLAGSAELENAAAQGDLSLGTAELQRWLTQHPNVLGVGLVDLTGVMRATGLSDQSIVNEQLRADSDWFNGALASDEPFLGTPGLSEVTLQPQVPYGVPVRDHVGTVQGVLITSISIEALSTTLTAAQVGPNARTSLNDNQHDLILAHVDPTRILQRASGRSGAARRLAAGQRGAMENAGSNGQYTLAAFSPVPGLPWGVIVQEPSVDAFAPVDEMIRQVVILIAVALVLAAGVGAGLAFGILRPIRRLRAVLEAMAVGELGQRVRATRQDELGELGRGFNRMADRLQDTLTDLQDGEARFRGIISAAFDGFAIHRDGRILEASSTFASLFGYGQDELVGRSVLDLAAPESRELITRNISAGESEPYECIGLSSSDIRFYIELVDNACTFEGRPARAIAVRDVTPRREAEEQRSRMTAIVDSSSEAIIGSAADGNVTHWNGGAERLYGYAASEIVGTHIVRLVPPERHLEYTEIGQRLSRDERIQNLETVRMHKDGTRIQVALSISPVRDGLGRSIGAAMVAHDITERKRAEAALQESETRYRRLVEFSPQAILVDDSVR